MRVLYDDATTVIYYKLCSEIMERDDKKMCPGTFFLTIYQNLYFLKIVNIKAKTGPIS